MRKAMWLGALAVGLGLISPAGAQQGSSFFGTINPADIKFVPVDTTKALAMPLPQQQPKSFNLFHFFPKLSLLSFFSKPKVGVSPLPPPSSFPQYQSPLYAVPPIVPGQ